MRLTYGRAHADARRAHRQLTPGAIRSAAAAFVPSSTRSASRAVRRARSAVRTSRSVSSAPAIRQTRASHATAPLRSHRILRLRQGHSSWRSSGSRRTSCRGSHDGGAAPDRDPVDDRLVRAIRWTLLRESRAAPSWAFTVVRAAQGDAPGGRRHPAPAMRSSASATRSPPSSPRSSRWGSSRFLWQAAVAGHHALGEPLRCVDHRAGRDRADDGDRARRARRSRVRAGRLDRRPRRARRPLRPPARRASGRSTTWSASPTAAASTCS